VPIALLRAVFTRHLACTRCGSEDVHPISGAYGPLVALVGFMRYACRACRRRFWIRTGAAHPLSHRRREHDDATRRPGAGAPSRSPTTPPPALDFDVPLPKHEKVDLTPLDADFEKIRRTAADEKKPELENHRKRRKDPS
jgi:hypothetical protein